MRLPIVLSGFWNRSRGLVYSGVPPIYPGCLIVYRQFRIDTFLLKILKDDLSLKYENFIIF